MTHATDATPETLDTTVAESQTAHHAEPAVSDDSAERTPTVLLGNLAELCTAMRAQQIARLTISYEGSGDSGEAEYPEAFDAQGESMAFDGNAPMTYCRRYRPDESEVMSLEDAAQELFDEVLDASNLGGYENNDGGGGTLTVFADGTMQLDHYDYVMEREESSFSFALPVVAAA